MLSFLILFYFTLFSVNESIIKLIPRQKTFSCIFTSSGSRRKKNRCLLSIKVGLKNSAGFTELSKTSCVIVCCYWLCNCRSDSMVAGTSPAHLVHNPIWMWYKGTKHREMIKIKLLPWKYLTLLSEIAQNPKVII